MSEALSKVRRSTFPREGDTWDAMQSWNMHVFMRPAAAPGSPREGNPILASDVIFLEPPQAG